ncbi:MAG TPA: class I SAM-dependent methyltransferase [Caulobacteraceae bacterium]|nr:class I SAM-dependent methyltransferase [Caulobacteraceae bacterium]
MERAAYDRMKVLETSHWWFLGRRDVLSRLLGGLSLPARARILEAGCGVGGNIEMLAHFGKVQAFEPDEPSRQYVSARTGVTPAQGYLPNDVPFKKKSFDAVCAFDMVEHVDDDAGAVTALGELVAPGGYLIVTVPAYQWMWSRHDEVHHHKRRYSRARILDIVRAGGLEPIKASYFNAVLFPLAAMVRFAKKLARIDSSDDAMPPAFVNGLFRRLFSLEGGWLANHDLPFGLSIVVIARRPLAEPARKTKRPSSLRPATA